MSRSASKHAFSRLRETCPAIDAAGEVATEAIKEEVERHIAILLKNVKDEGTEKLRAALIEAEQELLDANDRISELEAEVERLSRYVPAEES